MRKRKRENEREKEEERARETEKRHRRKGKPKNWIRSQITPARHQTSPLSAQSQCCGRTCPLGRVATRRTGSGVLVSEPSTRDKVERTKEARKQRLSSGVVTTHAARHAPRVATPGHQGQVLGLAVATPLSKTPPKALKNAKKKKIRADLILSAALRYRVLS